MSSESGRTSPSRNNAVHGRNGLSAGAETRAKGWLLAKFEEPVPKMLRFGSRPAMLCGLQQVLSPKGSLSFDVVSSAPRKAPPEADVLNVLFPEVNYLRKLSARLRQSDLLVKTVKCKIHTFY